MFLEKYVLTNNHKYILYNSSENLKKTYKQGSLKVKAVDNVNLEISDGEFTAIVGPSGSGKTTLLRSLNGLETIDSGEVIFDNNKITKEKNLLLLVFKRDLFESNVLFGSHYGLSYCCCGAYPRKR